VRLFVDPNLPHHRKIRKLAHQVDDDIPSAVGLVVTLWCAVMRESEDGVLRGWDASDIGTVVAPNMALSDQVDYVRALVDSGFLELNSNGVYSVHDWVDRQGDLIEIRRLGRDRQRRHRESQKDNGDVTRESRDVTLPPSLPSPPLPLPTLPYPSLPTQSVRDRGVTVEGEGEQEQEFVPAFAPAPKSGSIEAHLVSLWNVGKGRFKISQRKGVEMMEAYLKCNIPARNIEAAFMDEAQCEGRKIWDILEPMRRTYSDGSSEDKQQRLLKLVEAAQKKSEVKRES